MKKIVSTTLIISLLTSTLTPLTFAADMGYGGAATQVPAIKQGVVADPASTASPRVKADGTRVPAANTATQENNTLKTTIDAFVKKGITTLSPYEVVQAFVFISAYQAGVTSLDAAAGRATMDMALDKYAPNLSIRTTTKSPEGVDQQTYFSDTINAWAKKFSQEYDKVYAFVKDYMNTTRVATDPGVANKPEAAISTQSACDALIAKLMVEYENLVKLNAPYEKIREIKDKISQAQSSRDCTQVIKETVSVAPTTPVQQAAKIEEMKKGINFGTRVPNVIPNNIVPGYCEANYVSNLRDQLANNDVAQLEEIKTALEDAVTDASIENNSIKNSVLNLASQEVAEVQSQKVLEQGLANKEQITFNNFVRNLILVADSIVNTRAMNYLAQQVQDPQRFIDMFQTISTVYSSFQEFIAAGDLVYTWVAQDNAFATQKNTEQGIVFLFPATVDALTNNAKLTINAIKTKVFEVKQHSYLSTIYKGELTLDQFVQEVRKNGNWFAVSLYPDKLPYTLVETLKSNDQYRNNNDGTVNFFVAEGNGQRKAFADYNMTKWMTPGRYVDQRNNVYTVTRNGDVEQTYQTDSPERIVGRFDIDGRQLLGLDLRIGYDESVKYTDDEGVQPTTIDARLYIADYLITAKWSRTNRGSTWSMDGSIKIEGPSICNFTLVGSMVYEDNGTNGMPDMENPQTIQSANIVLSYNENEIRLTADDVKQIVEAAMDQGEAQGSELTVDQIIALINQYVQGVYTYKSQILAQLQATIDGWVQVIYPDQSQENIMTIVENNMGLLRMDNIMTIMQLFGSQSEQDSGEKEEVQPEQEAVDNNKFYATARGYDTANQPNRLYIAYAFDDTQSVNDINPDRVYAYVTYADGTYGEYDLMYETNYYVIESDKLINQDDQPGVQGRTDGMITSSTIYAQYTYNDTIYTDKQVIKAQQDVPAQPVEDDTNQYGYGYGGELTVQSVYTTNTVVQSDLVAVNLQKNMSDGTIQGFTDSDGYVTLYKTYGENCNVEPCPTDQGEQLVYDSENNERFTLNGVDITDPTLWYVSIIASYDDSGYTYTSQMGLYKK